MIYQYNNHIPGSRVKYYPEDTLSSHGFLKDDYLVKDELFITNMNNGKRIVPCVIEIGLSRRLWRMELCHEIGHILLGWRIEQGIERIRCEVLAWRIAKSICKAEHWDEGHALWCLNTYLMKYIPGEYNFSKVEIIPFKNGQFKFTKKLEY